MRSMLMWPVRLSGTELRNVGLATCMACHGSCAQPDGLNATATGACIHVMSHVPNHHHGTQRHKSRCCPSLCD